MNVMYDTEHVRTCRLDEALYCMDTFAILSFDVILSIYICMLYGIIGNKLCNYATKFFRKHG
jgi:hypothetical protein